MIVGALAATSLVALTTRMLISLGVVLAVVAVAYQFAKRRAGGPASRRRGFPRPRAGRARAGASGLEVVGRVGLTRGAAAVAVRFGDRVVLLAAGETGAASMVAEMPAAEWDERQVVREPIELPLERRNDVVAERPGFVEALRLATSRRG